MAMGYSIVTWKSLKHTTVLCLLAVPTDHFNQPHQYCLWFLSSACASWNSKSSKNFYPTLPSTMQQIREECDKGSGPKKVISNTRSAHGRGVISALDSCELPRNEWIVAWDYRQLETFVHRVASLGSLRNLEDTFNQFICDVKCLHESAVVMSTTWRLNDLVRFCSPPRNFMVDPI